MAEDWVTFCSQKQPDSQSEESAAISDQLERPPKDKPCLREAPIHGDWVGDFLGVVLTLSRWGFFRRGPVSWLSWVGHCWSQDNV